MDISHNNTGASNNPQQDPQNLNPQNLNPQSEPIDLSQASINQPDLRKQALQDAAASTPNNPQQSPAQNPNPAPVVEFTFRRVTDENDPAKDGFIAAYKAAFAGPPYFENFTDQWVEDHIWKPHTKHCLIVIEKDGGVLGLGCAHPPLSDIEPATRDFLKQQTGIPFDLDKANYICEGAILPGAQKKGIGKRLLEELMAWSEDHGYDHYVTKTALVGSNSAGLFRRIGAQELPFIEYVGPNHHVKSQSDARMWLCGDVPKRNP